MHATLQPLDSLKDKGIIRESSERCHMSNPRLESDCKTNANGWLKNGKKSSRSTLAALIAASHRQISERNQYFSRTLHFPAPKNSLTMALAFDWAQVRDEHVTRIVLDYLNVQLDRFREKMLGGFAYVEMLDLGEKVCSREDPTGGRLCCDFPDRTWVSPLPLLGSSRPHPTLGLPHPTPSPPPHAQAPLIALTALDELTDSSARASFRLEYASDLRLRVRVLAQFNPVVSTKGKVGARGRLLARSLEAHQAAYAPVWAEISEVSLRADVDVSYSPGHLHVELRQFPLSHIRVRPTAASHALPSSRTVSLPPSPPLSPLAPPSPLVRR